MSKKIGRFVFQSIVVSKQTFLKMFKYVKKITIGFLLGRNSASFKTKKTFLDVTEHSVCLFSFCAGSAKSHENDNMF